MMAVGPGAFSRGVGVLGRKGGWKTQWWLGSGDRGIPGEWRIWVGKTRQIEWSEGGGGVDEDSKEI